MGIGGGHVTLTDEAGLIVAVAVLEAADKQKPKVKAKAKAKPARPAKRPAKARRR